MLAAMARQPVDRVPLILKLLGAKLPDHIRFRGEEERIEKLLAIGIDDTIELHVPTRMHPDVKTRVWQDHPRGEPYPLLHKVYETPKGNLTQIVLRTDDWVHGDDIPLVSTYNLSRSKRFLVETEEDLARMKYLFMKPSDDQIRRFREHAAYQKKLADTHGCYSRGRLREDRG